MQTRTNTIEMHGKLTNMFEELIEADKEAHGYAKIKELDYNTPSALNKLSNTIGKENVYECSRQSNQRIGRRKRTFGRPPFEEDQAVPNTGEVRGAAAVLHSHDYYCYY